MSEDYQYLWDSFKDDWLFNILTFPIFLLALPFLLMIDFQADLGLKVIEKHYEASAKKNARLAELLAETERKELEIAKEQDLAWDKYRETMYLGWKAKQEGK